MSYMPISQEHRLNCPYMDCVAGMGLAGSGICFRDGEWDNPHCPQFYPESAHIIEHMMNWYLYVGGSGEIEVNYNRLEMGVPWNHRL